jgi:opacity protein-like surface antigen
MKIVRTAALMLLVAGAHAASAAEPGFYVGAGIGASRHDVDQGGARGEIFIIDFFGVRSVPRTSLDTDSDGTGWNGTLGYRVNQHLAAEVEYLDFGTSKIHETYLIESPFGSTFTIDQRFSTDVSGLALSGRAILPVGEQFELYARAGVLFADSKVRMEQRTETPTYADRVLFAGLGADWNFSPRWSTRLEYRRSKDIEHNLDIAKSHVELLSLSVLYSL